MAKALRKKPGKPVKKATIGSPFQIYWEKNNYFLFLAGFIFLIIGYYLMTIGPWDSAASITVSPIILFLAYIIIFPLAIFFRRKRTEATTEATDVVSES